MSVITNRMTMERMLRLIAGLMTMASVLLGIYHTPLWFFFTGFIAVNLIQSAFTDWCPVMTILGKLGFRHAGHRQCIDN